MEEIQKNNSKLFVSIRSPEMVMFEGEAESVSSTNEKGSFDVLPEHENFISLIQGRIIVNKGKSGKSEIPVQNGILKVTSNKVYVFLGLETLE